MFTLLSHFDQNDVNVQHRTELLIKNKKERYESVVSKCMLTIILLLTQLAEIL